MCEAQVLWARATGGSGLHEGHGRHHPKGRHSEAHEHQEGSHGR
jgi:hypothetical protein